MTKTVIQAIADANSARNDAGEFICYSCCADIDREYMRAHGHITLYLATSEYGDAKVTNWPGTLAFRGGYRKGRHNIAGTRYDAWFVFDGDIWHGVTYGDMTQICHCRRTKSKA